MKLILCQPSSIRFFWELEVLITNVRSLCDLDIILLFDNHTPNAAAYFAGYRGVTCYQYDDRRQNALYISSLRPYLWTCFLRENPEMTQEDFFYIDSDIIFREMIDFDSLSFHEKKYLASNADGYLSATYLRQKADFYVSEMAAVVGITEAQALEFQGRSGGAQWILSKPSLAFWEKIYHDSEGLYRYFILAEVMLRSNGALPPENARLQKWCADMWAILWNTKLFGIEVELPAELDFCWPSQPLEQWDRCKILHNAGVTSDQAGRMFYKGAYALTTPFETAAIPHDTTLCTAKYVEAIQKAKERRVQLDHQ